MYSPFSNLHLQSSKQDPAMQSVELAKEIGSNPIIYIHNILLYDII